MSRDYITVGIFRSKRSGQEYKVSLSDNQLTDETELSCNCRGWIFNRKCKHITHILNNDKILQTEVIEL